MFNLKPKNSILIVFFLSFFHTAIFPQKASVKPVIAHKVFFGFLGYGYNKYFDGLAANVGYEFHFNKNFVSATYHGFQQFTIFHDDNPEELSEVYLLFNRELINKPVVAAVGAGVAYTSITADINNFIPSPYGDYYTTAQVTKSMLALPLNLNISIPTKRKFSTGISVHSNFNSFTSFYSADIFVSYKF